MEIVKDIVRKEVSLNYATRNGLTSLALRDNANLKNFIEAQLTAMGEKGVSYIELWYQCEVMSKQLKELSK